ncbi:MAG: hypothetical protein ACFB51_06520 [Anaerolineae bacterium]
MTTYTYDADGSRVARETTAEDAGGMPHTTRTEYVMGLAIETYDGVLTKGTVYYGVGGAVRIIEPGDSAANTELYFRRSDHLGSTALSVDAQGTGINEQIQYGPFGEVLDNVGSAGLPTV